MAAWHKFLGANSGRLFINPFHTLYGHIMGPPPNSHGHNFTMWGRSLDGYPVRFLGLGLWGLVSSPMHVFCVGTLDALAWPDPLVQRQFQARFFNSGIARSELMKPCSTRLRRALEGAPGLRTSFNGEPRRSVAETLKR